MADKDVRHLEAKSVWLVMVDRQPSYFDEKLGSVVYTVAVQEEEWADVLFRVTQQVLESEARATKRKAAGKRKEPDAGLPDLDLPVELGGTASGSKTESLASCPEGRAGGAAHGGPARVRPQAEGRLKRVIIAR